MTDRDPEVIELFEIPGESRAEKPSGRWENIEIKHQTSPVRVLCREMLKRGFPRETLVEVYRDGKLIHIAKEVAWWADWDVREEGTNGFRRRKHVYDASLYPADALPVNEDEGSGT